MRFDFSTSFPAESGVRSECARIRHGRIGLTRIYCGRMESGCPIPPSYRTGSKPLAFNPSFKALISSSGSGTSGERTAGLEIFPRSQAEYL